jgi:hypothetical protein
MVRIVGRLSVEDREAVSKPRLHVIGNNKLPGKMVKRRPEVLEVVASNGAPMQWRLASDSDSTEHARGLNVYMGYEDVGLGFGFEEGFGDSPERLKMQLCPL